MRSLVVAVIALGAMGGAAQAQQAPVMASDAAVEAGAVEAGAVEAEAVTGQVARAAFTTGISDREPVDDLNSADTSLSQVYFFTELLDLKGEIVTHRWQYQGNVMAEVSFDVGGPRWRVYSSKNLAPGWTGNWYVDVVDTAGNVLYTGELSYSPAP